MKNKKIITLCIIVILLITGLWGCSNADKTIQKATADSLNKELTEEDTKNFNVSTDMNQATIAGMNQFAQVFFEQLQGDENVFFSPYSIAMALSMAANGADGETKKEIENLLGIIDLEEWNANLQYLMNSFTDSEAVVNTANSIWWERDENTFTKNVEEIFFNPLQFYYQADLFNVDFSIDATVDVINEWVSEATDEMIPTLLDDLDEETIMLLINAVYFNGGWETEFIAEDTFKEEFYGTSSTSSVDMMHMYNNKFRYIKESGMEGIQLPYGDGSIVMDIFIPEEGSTEDITSLYGKLTKDERNTLLTKLSAATKIKINTLSMPKFTMEYKVPEMKNILINMGMKDSFDTDKANFDKVNPSMYISDVVHVAKVEVDEQGTKAAAATGLEFNLTSYIPEDMVDFIVNKPFIYLIRDLNTGSILFMGQINNLAE